MSIEIKHVEKISMTDAIPLAAHAWEELLQQGYTENTTLVAWDNQAFIAYDTDQGRAVGILTYALVDWKDSISVEIGYVLPLYRGQGIYRQLWNALVEKARETQRIQISGTTHWDNKPMQAVMESLGRKPAYIGYQFKLEPHPRGQQGPPEAREPGG